MVPRVSKEKKRLVFLDIGQHNMMFIFAVKRFSIFEISKELRNDNFVIEVVQLRILLTT